jgi:hypothetical protein
MFLNSECVTRQQVIKIQYIIFLKFYCCRCKAQLWEPSKGNVPFNQKQLYLYTCLTKIPSEKS